MPDEPEVVAVPSLPPPSPAPLAFNLRIDRETSEALRELGGLRREKPGTVARKLLQIHARQELAAMKAAERSQAAG